MHSTGGLALQQVFSPCWDCVVIDIMGCDQLLGSQEWQHCKSGTRPALQQPLCAAGASDRRPLSFGAPTAYIWPQTFVRGAESSSTGSGAANEADQIDNSVAHGHTALLLSLIHI